VRTWTARVTIQSLSKHGRRISRNHPAYVSKAAHCLHGAYIDSIFSASCAEKERITLIVLVAGARYAMSRTSRSRHGLSRSGLSRVGPLPIRGWARRIPREQSWGAGRCALDARARRSTPRTCESKPVGARDAPADGCATILVRRPARFPNPARYGSWRGLPRSC
jgi:hypothetical protein